MSLAVPPVTSTITTEYKPRAYLHPGTLTMATPAVDAQPAYVPLNVSFDSHHHEILFNEESFSPVRNGDWVTITLLGKQLVEPLPAFFF
jgi:hypothetical protein